MAIKFRIGGTSTVIPGVYDQIFVSNSLPAAAPAGRSVLLIGESTEGVPGEFLDIRKNFYQDINTLKDFYGSGDLVAAARQIMTKQPSDASFPGQVDRVYVYKTNSTTRAEKEISSPANFGDMVAARFGEGGNLIKSQIKDSQTEVKPSKTFAYLPSTVATSYRIMVNGKVNSALAVAANGVASDFVTAISGASGLTVTGGTAKTAITGGTMDLGLTATNDELTLTQTGGAGSFDISSISVGDTAYIAVGTSLAGASSENVGAYSVVSVSATSMILKQLKKMDATGVINTTAYDLTAVPLVADADLKINSDVTIDVTEATSVGMSATLEILEDSASVSGLDSMLKDEDFSNLLDNSTSLIASASASVPSAGSLKIQLSVGFFNKTLKAGDLIRINKGSLMAGATDKNVGYMVVTASTANSITAKHLHSGMTTEAVASVLISGANDMVTGAFGFVSSDSAAKRISSVSDRKVTLEASKESTGESFPSLNIGGNVVLEVSYYDASATACKLSIDAQRIMTITPTGTGLSTITINTKKYETLNELVTFMNTQAGLRANIPVAQDRQ